MNFKLIALAVISAVSFDANAAEIEIKQDPNYGLYFKLCRQEGGGGTPNCTRLGNINTYNPLARACLEAIDGWISDADPETEPLCEKPLLMLKAKLVSTEEED